MNEFAKFGRAVFSPFLCSHQMLAATPSQLLQMLHELLVALRGHPGHVFQEREGKFLVNPALSLFHPCEVALLNQVKKKQSFLNILLWLRCSSLQRITAQWRHLSQDMVLVEKRGCT